MGHVSYIVAANMFKIVLVWNFKNEIVYSYLANPVWNSKISISSFVKNYVALAFGGFCQNVGLLIVNSFTSVFSNVLQTLQTMRKV